MKIWDRHEIDSSLSIAIGENVLLELPGILLANQAFSEKAMTKYRPNPRSPYLLTLKGILPAMLVSPDKDDVVGGRL